MSARKGKKPVDLKKSAANGGGASAGLEVVHATNGAGLVPDESADADEAEAVEPAEALSDEAGPVPPSEAAPAFSQINELRPRSAGDPPAEDEQEPSLADGESDELDPDEPVESAPPPAAAPTTRAQLKRVIESLIFVSDQIITALQLARLVKVKQAEVRELIAEISADYEGRGIELIEVAGGYQFRSAAASAPFVRDLVSQRPVRLTRAQLETLALIAYRQPITRPEIDDVRGVDSGSAIKVLLDRDLVKILGRKDEAGRPLLYGTSAYFLEFFSMKTMQDLPTLREFTELNQEHRELFQRKTGEIPDLSSDAEMPHAAAVDEELDPDEVVVAAPEDTGESHDAADQTHGSSELDAADSANEASDLPSLGDDGAAEDERADVGSVELAHDESVATDSELESEVDA
jgi:segregation and condensation protein B